MPNQPQGNWVVSGAPEESEGVKFDLWGLLNRRKWLIFLGIITGVTLGFVYHYNTDPVFKSEASISIEPKNPYVAPIGRNEVLPGGNMLSSRHDKFITKKEFINNVFKKNDYFKLSSYANMTESEAVSEALKDLEVKPEREEPNIFILKFHAEDKEESKLVLNSIITAYNDDLNDKYSDETQKIANEFRSTTEQIFQRLERANDEYEDLRKKYPFVALGQGATLEQQKLRQLDSQLVASKNKLFSLRSERQWILDSLERGQSERDIIWILKNERQILNDKEDNQINRLQNTQSEYENLIRNLELQRVDLLQSLGEGHTRIQQIDRRIAYYQELLRVDQDAENENASLTFGDMIKLYLVKLDLAIREATQTMNANFNDYVNLTKTVKTITDGQYELRRKDKEIDLIHGWLKQAQTTLAQLDPSELDNIVSRSKEGFTFRVLAHAEDGTQVWPYLPVVLAIGGLLGLLAGFCLGYLVDIADKTYRNPDEITRQLNLPLIGHIPVISSTKRHLTENSYIHPLVCTYHRPKAQSSEAFRAVRTALFFNTQGRQHSVIQITSPTPGDGKSTMAVNLAVSIAQSGKRVLLIDGDMRRPTVHHSFGIKSNEGFATILAGDSRIDDVIFECEEIEGLSVMPCGRKPANPAELITSPRFQSLVDEVRQLFDFVIIDTPPVLAVTDPCPVAARVDGVILTLRIKKNIKVSSDRAAEILQNVGANVVGVVVNGVGANTGYGSQYSYGAYRAGYSYNGYGYGYGYGYGNYYEEKDKGPSSSPVPPPASQRIEHQASAEPPSEVS